MKWKSIICTTCGPFVDRCWNGYSQNPGTVRRTHFVTDTVPPPQLQQYHHRRYVTVSDVLSHLPLQECESTRLVCSPLTSLGVEELTEPVVRVCDVRRDEIPAIPH